MSVKKVKDITKTYSGYTKDIDAIFKAFEKTQSHITKRQKGNVRNLIKLLLLDTKISSPIVVDLEMGAGKSTVLLEFIKYMWAKDPNFSCIVIKKTIDECKDFVINLGIDTTKYPDLIDLEKLDMDEKRERKQKFYAEEQGEDVFIARAVRGFNFQECTQYENKADIAFGDGTSRHKEYDPFLCSGCPKRYSCKVVYSKSKIQDHRILVVTHARLFFSNEIDVMEGLKYFINNDGIVMPRKTLLIDEKIDTVEIESISTKEFNEIANKIAQTKHSENEQIRKVLEYIKHFPFPQGIGSGNKVIQIESLDSDFEFEAGLMQTVFNNDINYINKMNILQKFIQKGGTVSRHWRTGDEIITFYQYHDINNYLDNSISKCLILDATCRVDLDYCLSKKVFLDDIDRSEKLTIHLYHNDKSISKSKISKTYNESVKLFASEIAEIVEQRNVETLVVLHKTIRCRDNQQHTFKDNVKIEVKRMLDKETFALVKFVHFGQSTTGVNQYSNCKNIIILGALNKGSIYYKNKALALGKSISDEEEVKINEFAIDAIQQIGRTSVRKKEEANVYLLGVADIIEELYRYFKMENSGWELKYYTEFNIRNEMEDTTTWYLIAQYITSQLTNLGDTIRKSEVKEYVMSEHGKSQSAVEKAIKSSKFLQEELLSNGIKTSPKNNREYIRIK